MQPEYYTYDGQTLSLSQWAIKKSLSRSCIKDRIKKGMTFEEAINSPRPNINAVNKNTNTKVCSRCLEEKHVDQFAKLKRRERIDVYSICNPCNRTRQRDATTELRKQVIEYYSNKEMKCCMCGESRFDCLDLDHVHNDGGEKHRSKKYSNTGTSWYRKLIKEKPDGLQVLCRNCNWIKFRNLQKFNQG